MEISHSNKNLKIVPQCRTHHGAPAKPSLEILTVVFHWGSVFVSVSGTIVRVCVWHCVNMCVCDRKSARERGACMTGREREEKRRQTESRERSQSCGFVGYTINPVRWWRLADWWFNIPSHALYGTYNGPDVTMETKHPSQSLHFLREAKMQTLDWICMRCLQKPVWHV